MTFSCNLNHRGKSTAVKSANFSQASCGVQFELIITLHDFSVIAINDRVTFSITNNQTKQDITGIVQARMGEKQLLISDCWAPLKKDKNFQCFSKETLPDICKKLLPSWRFRFDKASKLPVINSLVQANISNADFFKKLFAHHQLYSQIQYDESGQSIYFSPRLESLSSIDMRELTYLQQGDYANDTVGVIDMKYQQTSADPSATFHLTTNIIDLMPGDRIRVSGHPTPDYNQAMIVTALHFEVRADGVRYQSTVTAVCESNNPCHSRKCKAFVWNLDPRHSPLANSGMTSTRDSLRRAPGMLHQSSRKGRSAYPGSPTDTLYRAKVVKPQKNKTYFITFDDDKTKTPIQAKNTQNKFTLQPSTPVIVSFINDDFTQPVILGCIASTAINKENPQQSLMHSPKQQSISFDDKEESATIKTDQELFSLSNKQPNQLHSHYGDLSFYSAKDTELNANNINIIANQQIQWQSKQSIYWKSTEGDIHFKTGGDCELLANSMHFFSKENHQWTTNQWQVHTERLKLNAETIKFDATKYRQHTQSMQYRADQDLTIQVGSSMLRLSGGKVQVSGRVIRLNLGGISF